MLNPQAIQAAQNYLAQFAATEDFESSIESIFGTRIDRVQLAQIRQQWLSKDSTNIPPIEIRTSFELNGASGGFAKETGKIYLAQELLENSSPEKIISVLLEEYGHFIDSQLNITDSLGDEGEIFSNVVRGKVFAPELLKQLQSEDDTSIINLDGYTLQIETSTTGLVEGDVKGSTQTIKLQKGEDTATYSYEMFSIPDNLILRYEGKDILNTGFVSNSKTGKVNIPKGISDELQVVLATNEQGTLWNYQIDTSVDSNSSLLKVSLVSGNKQEKDGKSVLQGTINIGRQGLSPIISVEGTVEYDAQTISVDGVVSSLIGTGSVKTTPLFKSKFDIDVKTATGSLTEDAGLTNQYKLGGLDVDFSSLSLNPNGIALGAKFKLIEDLGLPDYFFSGSDALLISQNDVKFGPSVKFSLPNFENFKLFKYVPVKKFSDFSIEYIAPEDKIKIQGKLVIDPFAKPDEKVAEVTADFADDNFIQIQGGKADIKGSLAVATDLKTANGWGLSEIKLNLDTQNKDIGGSAKVIFPFGAKFPPKNLATGDFGLGFKLPIPPLALNKLSIEFDDLQIATPINIVGIPVYLQRLSGSVDNLSILDPDPIEFSGGISATLGPQYTDGEKASIIRLDVDAKISSEELSATGKATFINEKVGVLDGAVTLNWNKGFLEEKGNFSFFDGFVKTSSGFKTDSQFNIAMTGNASVSIPNSVPLFGGTKLGSGNYLLDFSNDKNSSNDFIAGWGTINIQKFGFEANIVAGAKLYFDGNIERLGSKNLPPVGSWAVAANTPWIVLSANWENELGSTVPVQIETSDGRLLNESEFSANNIAFVDELTNSKTKTVIIFNPTAGVWDIEVPNKTGLGAVKYNAVTNSKAPTIEITTPASDVTEQNAVINYNAFDSDSNAKVSLFYDNDNKGFDGILIKDGLAETDGAGNFIWNTEGISTGDYYIYGMAMDENNPVALNYGTGRVKVTESAELSIAMTANANSINVGNNLTYTISVTNNGASNAKGVTLTDILPDGVNFISASVTPTTQSLNNLVFDLGDLESGKSTTLNIIVTPPLAGILTNTATIKSKTYDPNRATDTVIVDTKVVAIRPALADLLLTTDAIGTPVNLGDKITYTLTVTNNGEGEATGVQLIDNFASLGVKDILATASKGSTSIDSKNNIIAELGSLKKGEKSTVTITATSIVADSLINTATVSSNEEDLNTGNNFLVQNKAVNPIIPTAADLELTQTVNNVSPKAGEEVNFILSLVNKGVGIASSIKVKDIIPSGLEFISATPEQGTYDSQTGIWDVGNMRDNLTRTLKLTAKVNQGGAITNTAELISVNETDPDSTPNNNNPNEDDLASVTLNVANGLPVISLLATDADTAETPTGQPANPGQFTLTRTGITTADLTVTYTLTGTGTNGVDYQTLTSTVTFKAGSDTAIVDINTIDDNIYEGNETITLTLAENAVAYKLAEIKAGTVTITDDETKPVIYISDAYPKFGKEGDDEAADREFDIYLSNPSVETVTVEYATVDGTAVSGSDFEPITLTTLTFAPGETRKTVSVKVIDDAIFENNENFKVQLTNSTNATIGDDRGIAKIIDDDLPGISLLVTDSESAETKAGKPTNPGEFTFKRTGVTTDALTVKYTIEGSAINGTDYKKVANTLTFAAGSDTSTIEIKPLNDQLTEGTESVILKLRTSDDYTIVGKKSGTVNITDLVLKVENIDKFKTPVGTELQGKLEGEVIDLRSFAAQTLKVDTVSVGDAAYQNYIGFYAVEDAQGTLANGLKVGDAGYAEAAIKSAILRGAKIQTQSDLTVSGGKIFAPVVIANGTFEDFLNRNPQNQANSNIHAYFNYTAANTDKVDHFRLLGNNKFGVEDLYGGGDRDYNDIVIQLTVKA